MEAVMVPNGYIIIIIIIIAVVVEVRKYDCNCIKYIILFGFMMAGNDADFIFLVMHVLLFCFFVF